MEDRDQGTEWTGYVLPILREVYAAEQEGRDPVVGPLAADLTVRQRSGVWDRIKEDGLASPSARWASGRHEGAGDH